MDTNTSEKFYSKYTQTWYIWESHGLNPHPLRRVKLLGRGGAPLGWMPNESKPFKRTQARAQLPYKWATSPWIKIHTIKVSL